MGQIFVLQNTDDNIYNLKCFLGDKSIVYTKSIDDVYDNVSDSEHVLLIMSIPPHKGPRGTAVFIKRIIKKNKKVTFVLLSFSNSDITLLNVHYFIDKNKEGYQGNIQDIIKTWKQKTEQ